MAAALPTTGPPPPPATERRPTGISGLDPLIGGGFPHGFVMCVMGSYGAGKTTLGVQFLAEGLSRGERCVFVTLEEDIPHVVAAAAAYGHDFNAAIEQQRLLIIKLSPTDARATLRRINSELLRFLRESGAGRVVIDSASLLSSVFENDVDRRMVLFEVANAIRESGASGVLTAELADANRFASRDGLVEYVADGVMGLRFVPGSVGEADVALELTVLKMRRTAHSRKVVHYDLTDKGVVVRR